MITGFTGSSRRITSAQKAAVVALTVSVTELHHGDCIVGDEWAHRCAVDMGKTVVIHPPDEQKARAFCLRTYPGENVVEMPTKPYLARNEDIVDAAEHLIAVPNRDEADGRAGGGVWATVRYARDKRIPITIVWPDGRIEEEQPKPPPKPRKSAAKKAPAKKLAAVKDAPTSDEAGKDIPADVTPVGDEGGGKSW